MLEQLVGELGLGERGLAVQLGGALRTIPALGDDGVEAAVDLGVDAADEERRDRRDARGVAPAGDEALEAALVGLDHPFVAIEREDQRHVHASSFGDHRLDRRQSLDGGGDLDEQVRLADALVQRTGRVLGPRRVVRQPGEDLDRDEAVAAPRGVVEGAQDGERTAGVEEHQLPVRLLDRRAAADQLLELRVVGVARLDRLGHDRRVGGQAAHALGDEAVEATLGDVGTAQVVDPRALALLVVQLVQAGHDASSSAGGIGLGSQRSRPWSRRRAPGRAYVLSPPVEPQTLRAAPAPASSLGDSWRTRARRNAVNAEITHQPGSSCPDPCARRAEVGAA